MQNANGGLTTNTANEHGYVAYVEGEVCLRLAEWLPRGKTLDDLQEDLTEVVMEAFNEFMGEDGHSELDLTEVRLTRLSQHIYALDGRDTELSRATTELPSGRLLVGKG